MPLQLIDTLKPKNNGTFPVAEAADIAVTNDLRLPEALADKADVSALAETNVVVRGKANAADLTAATTNLQGQINQIEISATAESVVAPEVAAARVGDNGTSYQTLKDRLDSENSQLSREISELKYMFTELETYDGQFINYQTGNRGTSEIYSLTRPIRIDGYTKIAICSNVADDSSGMAFYDEDLSYISGYNTSSKNDAEYVVDVPTNAKYIAWSVKQTYKDSAYIRFSGVIGKIENSEKELSKQTCKAISPEWIAGKFINKDTGNQGFVATYSCTDYINIDLHNTIRVKIAMGNDTSGICFYDEDKMYISGFNNYSKNYSEIDIVVPSNAKYCRITCFTDYISNSVIKLLNDVNKLYDTLTKLTEKSVTLQFTDGRFVNYETGKSPTFEPYSCSQFIKVFPYHRLSLLSNCANDVSGMAFYDINQKFIEGKQLYPYNTSGLFIEIPKNAYYMRFSCRTTEKSVASCKLTYEFSPEAIGNIIDKVEYTANQLNDNIAYSSVGMFNRVGGVGDSYTEGTIYNSEGYARNYPNNSWLAVMARKNGIEYANYGKGGATTGSYIEDKLPAVLADDPCDLYIFALGQNDINQSTTVGDIDDIHDEDYTLNPDTFYGNYGSIIQQIKEYAPKAKMLIVASWLNYGRYQSNDGAIAEIAEHYGFPVIYPFNDAFFPSDFYVNYAKSGHPVKMQHAGMGLAMDRLISKCIRDNPEYFQFASLDN